jgi:hypothetical protein
MSPRFFDEASVPYHSIGYATRFSIQSIHRSFRGTTMRLFSSVAHFLLDAATYLSGKRRKRLVHKGIEAFALRTRRGIEGAKVARVVVDDEGVGEGDGLTVDAEAAHVEFEAAGGGGAGYFGGGGAEDG